MYWFRRQIWLWRDYANEHPYRTLGALGFMLIGGIIWGSLAGSYLRPLVNPPAPSYPPVPVFTSTATPKLMRKPLRPRREPPQPTYRPRVRHTAPRPTYVSHTPSPRPTRTKSHGPCWLKPTCPPTATTPAPSSSSPTTAPVPPKG